MKILELKYSRLAAGGYEIKDFLRPELTSLIQGALNRKRARLEDLKGQLKKRGVL